MEKEDAKSDSSITAASGCGLSRMKSIEWGVVKSAFAARGVIAGSRRAGGLDMNTRKLDAGSHGPHPFPDDVGQMGFAGSPVDTHVQMTLI